MSPSDPAHSPWAPPGSPLDPRRSGYTIVRLAIDSAVLAVTHLFVQLVALLVMVLRTDTRDPELEMLGTTGLELAVATLASTALCVPLLLWLASRRVPSTSDLLGLVAPPRRALLLWCAAGAAFLTTSDLLTIALGRPVVVPFMESAYSTSGSPVLLFLALALGAPLGEELFFRGLLLGGLRAVGAPLVVSVGVTSLLWAMLHVQYDLYGIATIFVMGLLLGVARHASGSLVPPLVIHVGGNTVAFVQTLLVANG